MQLAPTKRRRRRLRPRGRRRRAGRRRRSRTRAGWRRGRRDEHLRPAARRRRRRRGRRRRRSFQRASRRRRRRGRFQRASRQRRRRRGRFQRASRRRRRRRRGRFRHASWRRWRRRRGRFRHASRRRWRRRRGRFRHASRRRRRGRRGRFRHASRRRRRRRRRWWWLGHTARRRWRRWRRWRWLQCPALRRRCGPSSPRARADSSPRRGLRLRRSLLFSGFSARFLFDGARERLRRVALQRERNRGRRRQRRFRSVGRRIGVGIGRVCRNLVEIRDARVFLRWPTFRVCFSSRNRDVRQRATWKCGSVTSRHFGTPLFFRLLATVATRRGSKPFAFWSVAFQFLYRARGLAPARRRAERVGARRRLDFARFAF